MVLIPGFNTCVTYRPSFHCQILNSILHILTFRICAIMKSLYRMIRLNFMRKSCVKVLLIVIIDFKRYPCTYCLMQG